MLDSFCVKHTYSNQYEDDEFPEGDFMLKYKIALENYLSAIQFKDTDIHVFLVVVNSFPPFTKSQKTILAERFNMTENTFDLLVKIAIEGGVSKAKYEWRV